MTPAGNIRASLSVEVGLCVSDSSALCCTAFEPVRPPFSAFFSASFAARVSSRCNSFPGGGEGGEGGGGGDCSPGGGECSAGGGGGGEGSGGCNGLWEEAAGKATEAGVGVKQLGRRAAAEGAEAALGKMCNSCIVTRRTLSRLESQSRSRAPIHKQPGASGGGEVSEGAQITLRWDQVEA